MDVAPATATHYPFFVYDEENKLCILFSNYASLGQWELARATIRQLYQRNAHHALRLLRRLIYYQPPKSWLCSLSLPSPAHLSAAAAVEYIELSYASNETVPQLPPLVLKQIEFEVLLYYAFEDYVESETAGISEVIDELRNYKLSLLQHEQSTISSSAFGKSRPIPKLSNEALRYLKRILLKMPTIGAALAAHLSSPNPLFVSTKDIQRTFVEISDSLLVKKQVDDACTYIRYLDFAPGSEKEIPGLDDLFLKLIALCHMEDSASSGEVSKRNIARDLRRKLYNAFLAAENAHPCAYFHRMEDAYIARRAQQDPLLPAFRGYAPSSDADLTAELRRFWSSYYTFLRISHKHFLEYAAETALERIRERRFDDASLMLRPFPRLKPLLALMTWHQFDGDIAALQSLSEMLSQEAPSSLDPTLHAACQRLEYRIKLALWCTSQLLEHESTMSTGAEAASAPPVQVWIGHGAAPIAFAGVEQVANAVLRALAEKSLLNVLCHVMRDLDPEEVLDTIASQPPAVQPVFSDASTATVEAESDPRMRDVVLAKAYYAIAGILELIVERTLPVAVRRRRRRQRAVRRREAVGGLASHDVITRTKELIRGLPNLGIRLRILEILYAVLFIKESNIHNATMPSRRPTQRASEEEVDLVAVATEDKFLAPDWLVRSTLEMLSELWTDLPVSGDAVSTLQPRIEALGQCLREALWRLEIVQSAYEIAPPPPWELPPPPSASANASNTTDTPVATVDTDDDDELSYDDDDDDDTNTNENNNTVASMSTRRQPPRSRLMNRLLASPQSLLAMCMRRRDYRRCQEIIRFFQLDAAAASQAALAEQIDAVVPKLGRVGVSMATGEAATATAESAVDSRLITKFIDNLLVSLPAADTFFLCLDLAVTTAQFSEHSAKFIEQATRLLAAGDIATAVDTAIAVFVRRMQMIKVAYVDKPLCRVLTGLDTFPQDLPNLERFLADRRALRDAVVALRSALGAANVTAAARRGGDTAGANERLLHKLIAAFPKSTSTSLGIGRDDYLLRFLQQLALLGDAVATGDAALATHNPFELLCKSPQDHICDLAVRRGDFVRAERLAAALGTDLTNVLLRQLTTRDGDTADGEPAVSSTETPSSAKRHSGERVMSTSYIPTESVGLAGRAMSLPVMSTHADSAAMATTPARRPVSVRPMGGEISLTPEVADYIARHSPQMAAVACMLLASTNRLRPELFDRALAASAEHAPLHHWVQLKAYHYALFATAVLSSRLDNFHPNALIYPAPTADGTPPGSSLTHNNTVDDSRTINNSHTTTAAIHSALDTAPKAPSSPPGRRPSLLAQQLRDAARLSQPSPRSVDTADSAGHEELRLDELERALYEMDFQPNDVAEPGSMRRAGAVGTLRDAAMSVGVATPPSESDASPSSVSQTTAFRSSERIPIERPLTGVAMATSLARSFAVGSLFSDETMDLLDKISSNAAVPATVVRTFGFTEIPATPLSEDDERLFAMAMSEDSVAMETAYVSRVVDRLLIAGDIDRALAVADAALPDGASDFVLRRAVETKADKSDAWRHIMRLRNRDTAAALVMKYVDQWPIDVAVDIVDMCRCHFVQHAPHAAAPFAQLHRRLELFGEILSADAGGAAWHGRWQNLDAACRANPNAVVDYLVATRQFELARKVVAEFKMGFDVRMSIEERHLLDLLLNNSDTAAANQVLAALDEANDNVVSTGDSATPAVQLVERLLEKVQDNAIKLYLVQYLMTHGRKVSPSSTSSLAVKELGIKVLMRLPAVFQRRFHRLIGYPRLIVESLIMIEQIPFVALIFRDLPQLQDNELLHEYARKALSTERRARPAVWAAPELTGVDVDRDRTVRQRHFYPSAPSFALARALLSLCGGAKGAKAAAGRCALGMCNALANELTDLDLAADNADDRSGEATKMLGLITKLLHFAKLLFSQEADDVAAAAEGLTICDTFLAHVELLHAIYQVRLQKPAIRVAVSTPANAPAATPPVGALAAPSLDIGKISLVDFSNPMKARRLRDKLVAADQMKLALNLCSKCHIEAEPVWAAWGLALLRLGRFVDAKEKFRHCLRPAPRVAAAGAALTATTASQYAHSALDGAKVLSEIVELLETKARPDDRALKLLHREALRAVERQAAAGRHVVELVDVLSVENYLLATLASSSTTASETAGTSEGTAVLVGAAGANVGLGSRTASIGGRGTDDPQFMQCLYYLHTYGDDRTLLRFWVRHGLYDDATNYILRHRLAPVVFIEEVFHYCLTHNALDELKRAARAKLDEPQMRDLLLAVCKYLNSKKAYEVLLDFQKFMKDYVRAALTSIKLFLAAEDLSEKIKHLEDAKENFVQALNEVQRQKGKAASVTAAGSEERASLMSESEIIRYMKLINLQVDITKMLYSQPAPKGPAPAPASGAPASTPLRQLSLFGSPEQKTELIEKLLEMHQFDLAFRVLQDFRLPIGKMCIGAIEKMVARKQASKINDLLKQIKGTITDNEWDDVVLATIVALATIGNDKKAAEKYVPRLTTRRNMAKGYIACGKLKAAYLEAVKEGKLDLIETICEEAKRTESKTVYDMCRQYLAKHSAEGSEAAPK